MSKKYTPPRYTGSIQDCLVITASFIPHKELAVFHNRNTRCCPNLILPIPQIVTLSAAKRSRRVFFFILGQHRTRNLFASSPIFLYVSSNLTYHFFIERPMAKSQDGAESSIALQQFKPYISPDESPLEMTVRGLLLGAALGIVFGAASVYLGLRVGLTTSASIPIAVMAITILKKLRGNTVLENNIVQTVGSAGESIAAAVVFTIPALIFLGFPLKMSITLLIALTGGVLGVLMMIPLRRYLIVKEHGNLRFPEGTACAEIIKAGEVGGTSASKIFKGMGLRALSKGLPTLFGFWKPSVGNDFKFYPGSSWGMDVAPELMGVGYIIGWETSLIMV